MVDTEIIRRAFHYSIPEEFSNLSQSHIRVIVQSDRSNPKYWDQWKMQAYKDDGFPGNAFDSLGDADWTPFERYIWVRRMRSHKNLSFLTEASESWDIENEKIKLNFDTLEYKLKEEFTPANRIYLTERGFWYRNNKDENGNDVRMKAREDLMVLVRGKGTKGVTYIDILRGCRALFSSSSASYIESFNFDSFSPEGIPQLQVTKVWDV